MPTENRSNAEMVSMPRGLLVEAEAALRSTGFDVSLSADLRALLAQPAEQHQGEPIMLTAVATLADDGDGGLEPNWLLEGGTAELFAGMTLLVAENAPDLCSEDGSTELYTHPAPAGQQEPVAVLYANGSVLTKADCGDVFDICCNVETPLYTHADPGEVERLRASEKSLAVDLAESLKQQCADIRTIDDLRAQLASANADKKAYAQNAIDLQRRVQNADLALKVQTLNCDTLRAQLAELDALLRDCYKELLAIKSEIGFRGSTLQLIGRIDHRLFAAGADPETKS